MGSRWAPGGRRRWAANSRVRRVEFAFCGAAVAPPRRGVLRLRLGLAGTLRQWLDLRAVGNPMSRAEGGRAAPEACAGDLSERQGVYGSPPKMGGGARSSARHGGRDHR